MARTVAATIATSPSPLRWLVCLQERDAACVPELALEALEPFLDRAHLDVCSTIRQRLREAGEVVVNVSRHGECQLRWVLRQIVASLPSQDEVGRSGGGCASGCPVCAFSQRGGLCLDCFCRLDSDTEPCDESACCRECRSLPLPSCERARTASSRRHCETSQAEDRRRLRVRERPNQLPALPWELEVHCRLHG